MTGTTLDSAENHHYGHAAILADYCGLGDREPPIWGYLQHGWTPEEPWPNAPWMRPWLPQFVWNQHNAERARLRTRARVTPIGAPYLYLVRMAGGPSGRPERGTIVYPFHSWEKERTAGSHRVLADLVLEREGPDATVCLYWLEHDQPDVRSTYEERGFRVISHGRRENRDFLRRQFAELRNHRRVVSNRLGTAVLYGALGGAEVQVYGPVFGVGDDQEAAAFDKVQRARWPALFTGQLRGEEATALAEVELGQPFVREPAELARLAGWSGARLRAGEGLSALYRRSDLVRRLRHKRRVGTDL